MPNPKTFIISKLTKVLGAVTAQRFYEDLLITLFALLYYSMAVWGLRMAFQDTNATPMWPPSGIAFTAILVFGYRFWPGIWLGAFFANVMVFMSSHSVDLSAACLISIFIGVGNTLESLLGVFLLSCFAGSRHPLFRVQDIFKFVVAVCVAALVSATTGTTAVGIFKHLPWPVLKTMWYTWWMGDVLSILILTPIFLIVRKPALKIWPAKRILEAAVLLTILIGIDSNIFGWKSFFNTYHFPAIYLILPLMVWATYRFSYWGVTAVSIVTLFWGFTGTTHGLGPFVSYDLNVSLLLLQSFIGIMTVTGLVLAAALHERRQAEEAQLYLAYIIENSDEAIIGKFLDGTITSWNKGARRLYGYTAQEIIGRPVDMLVPAEKKEELAFIFRQLKQGHKTELLETVRLAKDGRPIDVLLTVSPIKDSGGHLIGASAIAHDITERRKSQLALQESELRFRTLADTAPVMIWMSGADMICTFFNKAWLDFRGQGMDHELGHGWIQGLFQDDIKRCWAIYMKAFKGRETFTMDYRLRRADGKYRWILATGVPRFTADGEFAGYIGSCIDITERKLAEEVLKRDKESLEKLVDERSKELLSTQKELKQASRLADIGTLAATVAHELRNPLGVIQMAAYNLKKKTKSLEMDKHLINIEKKVWEGNGIIDNLLSYSRIKIPSYERVMLFNILDECVGTTHSRFHDYNIVIEKKYDLNPDAIEADPTQIREVFINILNNACQSFLNKTGKIEVIVKPEPQGRVSIVFSDNGTGIDEEDLDKIFEPFFTRKSKGTGLGLTICNELVSLHHGKIEIKSRKGEGTVVSIILPAMRNLHV